jgi:hypothetical protein
VDHMRGARSAGWCGVQVKSVIRASSASRDSKRKVSRRIALPFLVAEGVAAALVEDDSAAAVPDESAV